jgi:hypothetical protein
VCRPRCIEDRPRPRVKPSASEKVRQLNVADEARRIAANIAKLARAAAPEGTNQSANALDLTVRGRETALNDH